ncbi:MAG: nucleoside triphosphate pyrophosphohydrolase [Eggerthellaceae bacterium]|nr:nucleoside triphosphate pyrophosphohydrolase [Eggerthellaceae bacterium]
MSNNYLPTPDPAAAPGHPDFNAFVQTIACLRDPQGGCPWDKKQTHASVADNMIEEAYEAVAAIEEGDVEHMREELGDVLLQVVLQAQIAADNGEFTFDDVARDVNAKIVRRHPHVFGPDASFAAAGLSPDQVEALTAELESKEDRTADEVLDLWDVIKLHERKVKEQRRAERMAAEGQDLAAPRGVLDDVSRSQPALMRAQEVSRKTVKLGFEWETVDDVWEKVDEEIGEFKAAVEEHGGQNEEAQLEFGDVLFALVNVARKEHIDAEAALRLACDKFTRRWEAMERACHGMGRPIESCTTPELEDLWQQAKLEVG